MNSKAKKLINELNALYKKEQEENKQTHDYGKVSAYENRLLSLTEEEIELITSSYFESEDAQLHWKNIKACY